MVQGVIQATLYSSADKEKLDGKPIVKWSLPAWVQPSVSASFQAAFPPDKFKPTIIHARIAEALGIDDGDEVEFELEGEKLRLPVSISETIASDFTIGGNAGIATSAVETADECKMELENGNEITLKNQELFAGKRPSVLGGRGILFVHGVSRHDPHGPAGYGFCIYAMNNFGRLGDKLVSGYRHCGSVETNIAEYEGVIEGLVWTLRFNFEKLWIRGDATHVIDQLRRKEQIKNANLKPFYRKAAKMLQESRTAGAIITFQHLTREKNTESDVLANMAIDLKHNAIACNWENINQVCSNREHSVKPVEKQKKKRKKKRAGFADEKKEAPKVEEQPGETVEKQDKKVMESGTGFAEEKKEAPEVDEHPVGTVEKQEKRLLEKDAGFVEEEKKEAPEEEEHPIETVEKPEKRVVVKSVVYSVENKAVPKEDVHEEQPKPEAAQEVREEKKAKEVNEEKKAKEVNEEKKAKEDVKEEKSMVVAAEWQEAWSEFSEFLGANEGQALAVDEQIVQLYLFRNIEREVEKLGSARIQ